MKKHKLEGYCIRGGKEIADRIRKVFEADGVIEKNLAYSEENLNYFIGNTGGVELKKVDFDSPIPITIEEAERIVFGEPENTFPRMMEVSEDGEFWFKYEYVMKLPDGRFIGVDSGEEIGFVFKHAREIQPEPSPEITDELMIKAVERVCEMLGKKYGGLESIRVFDDYAGAIISGTDKELFQFKSIPELIKHLRDEK